jgi:hypothetical protein
VPLGLARERLERSSERRHDRLDFGGRASRGHRIVHAALDLGYTSVDQVLRAALDLTQRRQGSSLVLTHQCPFNATILQTQTLQTK